MPVYEYKCPCCKTRLELRRGFNDESPVLCPQCGSNACRVFSPVPVIFKGSGFYSTDYRQNKGHEPEKEETEKTKADSSKDSD
ncbi:MAG: zinc ribbon domain-containing protein [Dehalococcoidales bacterium]|nr:zinc ribbon domain-containing protein [Dehalococcoidales bacterium]